jgi:PAS domain S-box-containing protein
MAFPGTGKIWMNGRLVEWKDATIHIASHVLAMHVADAGEVLAQFGGGISTSERDVAGVMEQPDFGTGDPHQMVDIVRRLDIGAHVVMVRELNTAGEQVLRERGHTLAVGAPVGVRQKARLRQVPLRHRLQLGVLTRRRDHTIVAINQRTAEIFQIPQDRAVGRCATDYYAEPAQREELATRLKRDGLADNVRVQIKRQNGWAFWALVSARLVTCGGEPAVLTVFVDISEQLAAERALKASEQRLVAQSNALTGLTARYADPSDRFDERLRHILEVSAHTLQVERLSMWRFDDQRGLRHAGDIRRRRRAAGQRGLQELHGGRFGCLGFGMHDRHGFVSSPRNGGS